MSPTPKYGDNERSFHDTMSENTSLPCAISLTRRFL